MTARNHTADLLKGIAVILMIQVHIIELFANQTIFQSGVGKVLLFLGGPPVAPIFVIILGYFIVSSNKSCTQLIIRGLKIAVLGFCLNIALNFNLLISVYRGIYNIDVLPYIFGVDILQFVGISTIIIALLKKAFEKSIILLIFCTFISALLGDFLLNYIPTNIILKYISAFFYGSSNWSYFPLFPWLAYPLAGMLFYQFKEKINFSFIHTIKMRLSIGIIFLFFLVFTIPYAISVSSELTSYYHHGIFFFLWVILFLMFYHFFIHSLENALSRTLILKYIKWLGEHVTVIYIIQWIIIGNVATEIYKTVSSPLYLGLSFLLILGLASGLCYLVLKVKEQFK